MLLIMSKGNTRKMTCQVSTVCDEDIWLVLKSDDLTKPSISLALTTADASDLILDLTSNLNKLRK